MNKVIIGKMIVLAMSCIVLAACAKSGTPAQATGADENAINAAQDSWYKAYNAGDGAGVAALYADDAVLMAPGVPTMRGASAIRDYYLKDAAAFSASGRKAAHGPTSEIGISGDLAWQSSTYQVSDKSGATTEAGKSLTVFQRRNGRWMMIRDTWNSDAASPASAAPAAAVGSAPPAPPSQ